MDALEFLKEQKRMCNSYKTCYNCPFANSHCIVNHLTSDDDYEKIVNRVERWSKEHPRKTRQSVFLEQWPEAKVIDGVLNICPKDLLKKHCDGSICYNPYSNSCASCRLEFWNQEVE